MDYDVVRNNVQGAYKNFKTNDSKFYESMDKFYTEGKSNPSVAKIIMKDYILKNQATAKNMLADAAAIPGPAFIEPLISSARINLYNLALTTALKSIEAEDLYKNTKYIDAGDEELGSIHRKEFDASWKEKYPNTSNIRERLIKNHRISMDKINAKAGWYEKVNIAKTIAEYMKDYPKTFYTRYYLIADRQINENEVTPRVKNWFKRFSYKTLLKGKFSFKK